MNDGDVIWIGNSVRLRFEDAKRSLPAEPSGKSRGLSTVQMAVIAVGVLAVAVIGMAALFH
jgi:hypothetical protein